MAAQYYTRFMGEESAYDADLDAIMNIMKEEIGKEEVEEEHKAFSNFIGMPTMGFEKEVLDLIKRMEGRMERRYISSHQNPKEKNKLECELNYDRKNENPWLINGGTGLLLEYNLKIVS